MNTKIKKGLEACAHWNANQIHEMTEIDQDRVTESSSSPRVLVAVCTYGRHKFLPRLVASFLSSSYSNKKLIIINDCNLIRYSIVPEFEDCIEIINIDTRLNLDVKRNLFAAWDWDILMPLDDDDLFHPDHITNHLKHFQKDNTLEYVRNEIAFQVKWDGEVKSDFLIAHKITGMAPSAFTRGAFFKVGGYTGWDAKVIADDFFMFHKLKDQCNSYVFQDYNTASYLYWHTSYSYRTAGRTADRFKNDLPKIVKEMLIDENLIGTTFKIDPDFITFKNITNYMDAAHHERVPITLNKEGTSIISKLKVT